MSKIASHSNTKLAICSLLRIFKLHFNLNQIFKISKHKESDKDKEHEHPKKLRGLTDTELIAKYENGVTLIWGDYLCACQPVKDISVSVYKG